METEFDGFKNKETNFYLRCSCQAGQTGYQVFQD